MPKIVLQGPACSSYGTPPCQYLDLLEVADSKPDSGPNSILREGSGVGPPTRIVKPKAACVDCAARRLQQSIRGFLGENLGSGDEGLGFGSEGAGAFGLKECHSQKS